MKMTPADFETLKAAAEAVLAAAPDARQKYADAGLSAQRFRWDVLHATKLSPMLYDRGYADAHIDTALRRIVG